MQIPGFAACAGEIRSYIYLSGLSSLLGLLIEARFGGTEGALGQGWALLWMDEILHQFETMVWETTIYVGESKHSRVSERWCEMGFVHPQKHFRGSKYFMRMAFGG